MIIPNRFWQEAILHSITTRCRIEFVEQNLAKYVTQIYERNEISKRYGIGLILL